MNSFFMRSVLSSSPAKWLMVSDSLPISSLYCFSIRGVQISLGDLRGGSLDLSDGAHDAADEEHARPHAEQHHCRDQRQAESHQRRDALVHQREAW